MDAEEMLNELESNRLEVVLIPAPDQRHSGHSVRAVQEANADWYRKFCKQYLSGRKRQNAKGRTLIKRRATINALKKIVAARNKQKLVKGKGKISRIKADPYIERLLGFIEIENKREKEKVVLIESNWIPF